MGLPAVLFAVGTGFEITETLAQGKQAARIGKRNQEILEEEARVTEEVGLFESGEKRLEGKRLLASQIAQAGAQGGALTGTTLTLLADSAIEIERDARIITRNARLRAKGLRQQGAIERFEGQAARRASRVRAFSIGLKGAGKLFPFRGLGQAPDTDAGGVFEARDTRGAVIESRDNPLLKRAKRDRVRVRTIRTRSGGSLGTLRGRKPKRKGAFAGTNKSSASSPGTITA